MVLKIPPVCFHTGSSRQGALDLTELIGVPLPPSVSFVTGFEGYPAYSFGPDANVGRLAKSFIPDPFYYDFAVTVTAKPTTRRGGVLFAVTDAYQKVFCFSLPNSPRQSRYQTEVTVFLPFQIVHLGVGLSEVEDDSQRVVVYYTDPGPRGRTQEAASFKMGDLTGRWARFTLTVRGSEVGGNRRRCHCDHRRLPMVVSRRRCGLKECCHGQSRWIGGSKASCDSGATLHGL